MTHSKINIPLRNRFRKYFFALVCTTGLSGCASTGGMDGLFSAATASNTSATQYPATDPSTVKLYIDQKPNCKYTEIGLVNVDTNDIVGIPLSASAITQDFQDSAAKMGGTAVINITENLGAQSGTVVRCLN